MIEYVESKDAPSAAHLIHTDRNTFFKTIIKFNNIEEKISYMRYDSSFVYCHFYINENIVIGCINTCLSSKYDTGGYYLHNDFIKQDNYIIKVLNNDI